ncbi:uncharacterized protein N7515_005038 [Penicillium bovifimosum]|uniref:F-box domain-containing protein n=1 Tax=Penicillium bovifimosum TaxID=126998 RepID=A0A9W9H1E0_9EURO|nr:uncharacterized protein N7515_005038 [Penicillium bovifimosum]KAJ5135760.1 hypothetical protein N7515_005038 [Penicillium bovifimosum]
MAEPDTAGILTTLPPEAIRAAHYLVALCRESQPTTLLDLPVELLWLIERQLPDKDVYSLCLTNRYLYHVLNESLCRRGMVNLRALQLSFQRNQKQAFAKAVAALSPLPRAISLDNHTPPLTPLVNNSNVNLIELMTFKGGLLGQQLAHIIEFILRIWRRREESTGAYKWQSLQNCLKWGLSPNYVFEDGMSLMAQAIVKSTMNPYKQYREVEILLALGADTGCLASLPGNDSMLHLACLHHQTKIVQLLLDKGADPNLRDAQNRTPVHRLFDTHENKWREPDNLLDILLADPNVRIDERDGNGRTPLSLGCLAAGRSVNLLTAALKFAKKVVYLPDRVDINSQDNEGKAPLCHAISVREYDMIRLFIAQHGLDPNLGPADEFPLIVAVDFDKLPSLELLLDSKQLDLNQQNSEGETAVLKAIHIGNREAVKLLARAGADPDIKSCEGATARQAALDAGIRVRWRIRPN